MSEQPVIICAYCEEQPAIVQCGEISDAWEGTGLCGACWGFVLADPDEPRLVGKESNSEEETREN